MLAEEKLNAVYDTMRSGLFIVTSSYRKQAAGCTCLWVTRGSFNPPLLALYLAPARWTCETILKSKRFAVQAVPDDGIELARRFGYSSSRDYDKFAGLAWQPGISGVPLLGSAVSIVQCRLAGTQLHGDHQLLLGEVMDAQVQRDCLQLVYDPRTFYAGGEERRETQMGGSTGG